ncbi:MAG: BMP family ABC transporter substrate-binding protein, partial [Anaerolineales bacterium]|nr:BMP family ABC transporter substrate-binding protein [Anaerolineales bacterium]
MNRWSKLLVLFLIVAMILPGCSTPATEEPAPPPTEKPVVETAEETTEPVESMETLSFAMVTDQAGLGDQAFNDATWEGFTALNEQYGVEIKVVETNEQAQYVPNLSTLAEQEEDLIVGVGFLLKDAI